MWNKLAGAGDSHLPTLGFAFDQTDNSAFIMWIRVTSRDVEAHRSSLECDSGN